MFKIQSASVPSRNVQNTILAVRNNTSVKFGAIQPELPAAPKIEAEAWALGELKKIMTTTFVVTVSELERTERELMNVRAAHKLDAVLESC